ncbi:MAG TPA: sodium:proton antiporter [Kofleriaceae bacterium]
MTTIQLVALLVSLTAALAYVNARFIKLPSQVGMLAAALVCSLGVVGLDALGLIDAGHVRQAVAELDFGHTLVHGVLGLMLFAGALHIRGDELAEMRWPIVALSLGGTVASTVIVGGAMYVLLVALGHDVGWLDAMLFGALISPTDPIAVLGVLKTSKVPRALAVQISGESLFNDGVGVVLFTILLAMTAGEHVTAGHAVALFAQQVLGGVAFGLVLGLGGERMLRTLSDGNVQVLITLGLVLGGYAAAEALGVSAPIAAVVAGIVIGGRACSEHLALFWELIDEILNALVFLALGLEATRLHVSSALAIAAAVAVPIVLVARWLSVGGSLFVLRPFKRSPGSEHAVKILTWGGLRGGLSVALALSLPIDAQRDAILVMTYVVVAVAILVQGLTLPLLLRRLGLET